MKRKAENPLSKGYVGTLTGAEGSPQNRIMVGVPMTGLLRSEWVMARYGQVVPCNWSQVDCIQWLDQYSPLRFSVADARNAIASRAVAEKFEWLFFIDHDVVLAPVTILRLNDYMRQGDVPIVGGLYFTRGSPSEPLLYRGRGNSYYDKWHLGDKVWVDGMGLGCHLIHVSILKALADESEQYNLPGMRVWRIFDTPSKCWYDPESMGWQSAVGTEDLEFYSRIIDKGILKKAGWGKIAKKKWPFLCDTSLFCKHIDWNGVQYPARGEEVAFMTPEMKKELHIRE